MRSDVKIMQQDMSVIFDAAAKAAAGRSTTATKEITSTDPAAPSRATSPSRSARRPSSMKPTGQTKELLGRSLPSGYAIDMTVPMTVGAETLVMKMSGTIWIADKGPGVEEYKALTKAASESGFSTAFMAQGPTAKGMVEMQKAMAEAGIPLSQEFQMTMEGTGQAAAALAPDGQHDDGDDGDGAHDRPDRRRGVRAARGTPGNSRQAAPIRLSASPLDVRRHERSAPGLACLAS